MDSEIHPPKRTKLFDPGYDEPVTLYRNGRREHYVNGVLSVVVTPDGREGRFDSDGNLYYMITQDGIQMWFKNDLHHRDDGPAIITPEGDLGWFQYGKLHREDGPAFISKTGARIWLRNNRRHREDGPAVENVKGSPDEWWIDGVRQFVFQHPVASAGEIINNYYETIEQLIRDGNIHLVPELYKTDDANPFFPNSGLFAIGFRNSLACKAFDALKSALQLDRHSDEQRTLYYICDEIANSKVDYNYQSGELTWRDARTNQLHRRNGQPAVIRSDGSRERWVYGTRITH